MAVASISTRTAATDTAMDISRLRLWQLISPALPVGAYAYSAGMEQACDAGLIRNEADALAWVRGQLCCTQAQLDAPLLLRLHAAWDAGDVERVAYWNAFLQASRETRELLDEDRHLGTALAKLLWDLGIGAAEAWFRRGDASFATSFALAAVHWRIGAEEALSGYLWAWCENQVAAAIKLVPLGQTAGQRLLLALADAVPEAVAMACAIDDEDDIGAACPGVTLCSMRHETQYSRLFRS